MFPALFYFEICVFKEMNQLPSPLWPILQLHSIALSSQLRIALPEQAQGSLRGLFAVGQFARPFFLKEQCSESGKMKREPSGGPPSLGLQWASAEAEGRALIRFNEADVLLAAHHTREKPEVLSGKLSVQRSRWRFELSLQKSQTFSSPVPHPKFSAKSSFSALCWWCPRDSSTSWTILVGEATHQQWPHNKHFHHQALHFGSHGHWVCSLSWENQAQLFFSLEQQSR